MMSPISPEDWIAKKMMAGMFLLAIVSGHLDCEFVISSIQLIA